MASKYVALSILGCSLLAASAGAQPLTLEPVQAGLDKAVFVTGAGDGSGRLFIVGQEGQILILRDGALLPTPFLDIVAPVDCCGERGLLGLAFDPNYESNGRFYVNYTTNISGQLTSRVSRFTVNPPNADTASTGTEQTIIEYAQPAANHNAGWMDFGPDGYLYIATGDGGGGGDTWSDSGNAQDRNVVLGKMLRLNVSGSGTGYTIPPTNPFAFVEGRRKEIWAYGLRNPWRNSFDRATGDLYIGDVGQGTIEEISFQPAGNHPGVNYGWRVMEGNRCFDNLQQGGNAPCDDPSFTPPIYTYSHTSTRKSVTGGYVYRGDAMPRSRGIYFFADYNSGEVWSFRYLNGVGVTEFSDRTAELDPGLSITSFGEDDQGELYIVSPTSISRVIDPTAESVREEILPDFAGATGVDHMATFQELTTAGVEVTQETFDDLDANNDDLLSLPELLNVAGIGEIHHADFNLDGAIDMTELLRVVQLYNALRYSCSATATEDGFKPGPGSLDCARHSADYAEPQGSLSLSEILRVIQFYNTGGMSWCPDSNTEDGYCPLL